MEIEKTNRTEVQVTAPPAKAYTLRAILLSGLARGTSHVLNPLLAADQLAMIDCLQRLGVKVVNKINRLVITGGGGQFRPVKDLLDVNESGVGMNFLTSAVSFAGQPITLTGKPGLNQRPIYDLGEGLAQLGCHLEYLADPGYPPVRNPGQGIPGGHCRMSGAKNSQYFSSIAISAPYAQSPISLECTDDMTEKPYFDIALEMMAKFGISVHRDGYEITRIPNAGGYEATEITVEGDYSSASYYFTAAAVCRSTVHVAGLNPASLQGDKRMLELLADMGCRITQTPGLITVQGGELQGIETEMADIPDLVPSIAIAAAFATGTTIIRRIGHLRFKECNRVEAVIENLTRMGVKAYFNEDALFITGNPDLHGAAIDTYNDHRIAMSFAVAGLACGGIQITDEKCVGKSFPDFWDRLKAFY